VVTVRWAENLIAAGRPSTEFTWFPGYAWEIAWCSRCGEHLGWRFTAVTDGEPGLFWGLRRDAIMEERR
jgi:cereblon